MKRSFATLCGLVLFSLSAPAWAQGDSNSDTGMYFSLGIGGSEGGFSDSSWLRKAPTGSSAFEDDFTLTGLGSIGYQWMPAGYSSGLRFELEGSYRHSEVSQFIDYSGLPPTYSDAEGYLETIGIMTNGFMDMNVGESFTVHLGAGVGAVRATRRDLVVGGVPVTGKFTHSPAYQLMVGFGYRLSPGMIIGLDFRNMVVNDFTWPSLPTTTVNVEFKEVIFMIRLVG